MSECKIDSSGSIYGVIPKLNLIRDISLERRGIKESMNRHAVDFAAGFCYDRQISTRRISYLGIKKGDRQKASAYRHTV